MVKKAAKKPRPTLTKWIEELALQIKEAVERKDWDGVNAACAVESVWAFDRPLSRRNWIGALRSALTDAQSIQVVFLETARTDGSEERAHSAFTTQVIWTSAKDGSEKESTFTLALGASSPTGRPVLDYVGLTPIKAPSPAGKEPLPGGLQAFRAPQYFTQTTMGSPPAKEAGRYVVVYMPVYVPAEALK